MIDLHLSAFAPRWRFLYVVRIDAYSSFMHFPICATYCTLSGATVDAALWPFMTAPVAVEERILHLNNAEELIRVRFVNVGGSRRSILDPLFYRTFPSSLTGFSRNFSVS